MAPRKNSKSTQARTPPPEPSPSSIVSIWKNRWVQFAGGVAALGLLLTNINTILSNTRAMPGEIRKTSDQFFSWYGDYAAWKGRWTNYPEGYVDMAEMNLSSKDFRISIDETANGVISGSIETKDICDKVPYFDSFLVDGTISSSRRAEIDVFDYVGGYRRDFARLRLRRDGIIMTVSPEEDPGNIFDKDIRIALAPDDLKGDEGRENLCGDKKFKFIENALKSTQHGNRTPAKSAK